MNDSTRRALIQDTMSSQALILQITCVKDYLPGSRFAFRVTCEDGNDYAVKGIPIRECEAKEHRSYRRLYGRELFIEQVTARLGAILESPIPAPALVHLDATMIRSGTWIRCMSPTVCHGLEWIDDVEETRDLQQVPLIGPSAQNRQRLANLALLIGWITDDAHDTQVLLERPIPRRVFSVDHGLLAGGIPMWTHPEIKQYSGQSGLQPHTGMGRALRQQEYQTFNKIQEIRAAARRLQRITDEQIAEALAAEPGDWGVTLKQRVDLMRYLQRRRDQLAEFCLK